MIFARAGYANRIHIFTEEDGKGKELCGSWSGTPITVYEHDKKLSLKPNEVRKLCANCAKSAISKGVLEIEGISDEMLRKLFGMKV